MSGPGGQVGGVPTARRELAAAVLGSVAAGALALIAGGQGWAEVTVDRRPPLPPVTAVLPGSDVAPLVPAAGLVLLAAAVALLAVRGAGRVVVGLLVAAAGGALGWSGGRALAGGVADAATALPGVRSGAGAVEVELAAAWPVLALVAGLLAVVAGVVVVLRGHGWPGMGRRYERGPGGATPATTPATAPAARPETDEDRTVAAWKALDRGDDPTVEPTRERPA